MNPTIPKRAVVWALFFVSGYCSLVYQIVWVRLAFAHFGIIPPVLSVVLSVFMAGLGVGSWAAGRLAEQLGRRGRQGNLLAYAICEGLIGLGGLLVPVGYSIMDGWLTGAGEMDSARYLFSSAAAITVVILPWCLCMGATLPFMMGYLRQGKVADERSFSYLYAANVAGALTGVLLSAWVLIECWGFHRTLVLTSVCNFLAVLGSLSLLLFSSRQGAPAADGPAAVKTGRAPMTGATGRILGSLFLTGLASLSLEVVWTRAFTPILSTTIYAYALVLATYLAATWLGAMAYRKENSAKSLPLGRLAGFAMVSSFLPLFSCGPHHPWKSLGIAAGIFPLCFSLGYLTPRLIDAYAKGSPSRAGSAYAFNVAGCILGPLVTSYLLLPHLSAKGAMLLWGAAFVALFWMFADTLKRKGEFQVWMAVMGAFFIYSAEQAEDFETYFLNRAPAAVVYRDAAASTLAFGEGLDKRLLINGIGITSLSPVTKVMAHLPLAMLPHVPEKALVICFGMGTTFRAALSWDIRVTAVDLVPGVKRAFGYFFSDASDLLARPNARVVIDDGRRFLRRTEERYDLITLDPPPPPEAAGSSLLYSREFYILARAHLADGGILQQWFPNGERKTMEAVARSLQDVFPYVYAYQPVAPWGIHFLASDRPLAPITAEKLVARLPPKARQDLMEWQEGEGLFQMARRIVNGRLPIEGYLPGDPSMAITDDRPYNEYFFLRRWRAKT